MSRRPAAVALALVLLLAGCSGPGDAQARTVTHAMGTTAVPDAPVRVVVLDSPQLDAVAALGITPVGAAGTVPDYMTDALGPGASSITGVGPVEAPDLAAVAALEPDLILSSKVLHEAIYPQLAAIAPTVFTERSGPTWKEDFLLEADALGRTPDAEAVLAAYEAEVTKVGKAYGSPPALDAAVVRFVPKAWSYDGGSFVGSVLADVGFPVPPATDRGFTELTLAQLPRASGELLFSSSYLTAGARAALAARRTPAWRGLPAVRARHVADVADDIWFFAVGPVGAQLVLDDLEAFAPKLTAPAKS